MAVVMHRRIERHARGWLGRVCLVLFWAVNAGFLVLALAMLPDVANIFGYQTPLGRSIHAAAVGFAYVMIFAAWIPAAILTGALAFATRGQQVVVSVEERP